MYDNISGLDGSSGFSVGGPSKPGRKVSIINPPDCIIVNNCAFEFFLF